MVKRSKKVVARKSNAEVTIEEGRQFVYLSNRIRNRRISGTKTMKNIATSSSSGLRNRPKKQYHATTAKAQAKKKNIKKRVPKAAVRKIKKSKAPTKASRVGTVTASGLTAPPGYLAAFTLPAPVPAVTAVAPLGRTSSRSSNIGGGKVAKLSKSKSKDVQIPAFGFIDVCFCVDATGSMVSQLAQVQQVIKAIISNIQAKVQTQGLQMRFAIVTYRDHPPQESSYVTSHLDFTDQFEATQYLKTLTAMGGGDQPEAAHDGLLLSAKNLNWAQVDGTPVLRYIFHIADAPPHGKQFLNPQAQTGCLCGLQTDEVIREINKKSIHYRLIKARANPKVDQMQKIFRQKIGDFDSTDIGHARELNVKVSDMIIHEVLPDYA